MLLAPNSWNSWRSTPPSSAPILGWDSRGSPVTQTSEHFRALIFWMMQTHFFFIHLISGKIRNVKCKPHGLCRPRYFFFHREVSYKGCLEIVVISQQLLLIDWWPNMELEVGDPEWNFPPQCLAIAPWLGLDLLDPRRKDQDPDCRPWGSGGRTKPHCRCRDLARTAAVVLWLWNVYTVCIYIYI